MSVSLPSAELVGQIVGTVLEEAAFAFSEPASPDTPTATSGWTACIEFRALVSGELRLTLTHTLACQLCAGLLGLEPEDEEVQSRAKDTTGELTNILAGALLSTWLGETAEYELGTPAVAALTSPNSLAPLLGTDVVQVSRITDEGEPFDVVLRLVGGP